MQVDNRIVEFAHQMADAAGDVIRRYWRTAVPVDRKSDASPVTLADREVESAMRKLIEAHYPEHGIFGEEHGKVREQAAYQWVLDPIDGTRAFIAGYPTFTTLIALAHNGVPMVGVVDQAIMRERWTGIAGQKSTLNKKTIATRHCTELKHAAIATTSAPYYFSDAQTATFDRLRKQCAQTIIGGDGYGYAMLASGQIDIFVDACLKPYDFCAHKTIIEGAGGVITDWYGKPLTIESDGNVIAAATKELHQQALTILSAA